MKKIIKFGILLGLSILLSNCDAMQDATQQEVRQENIMTKISFDEFKSKASLNGKAKSLIGFFDVNKSSFKSGNNVNNAQGFEDATIVTESIIKIKQDDFTTYTFTILTQVEKNEFYNLVLYVNDNQEIYKSHILKYTPSEKWLSDRTQDFSGSVKIINNDVFDVKNLLQSTTSSSAKTTYLDNCIDNVYITYACSNNQTGHRENPRAENCDATDFYYYINITYVPCSGTSGNVGGNFDPNTSGGTTTSGGGSSGIVTAPNTIPYTSQLKSFESGTLNATERTYYQGNSNIRNTIDTYLINYGFSNNAKLDSKSALAFSSIYKLNFPQFNWVFTYRASDDLLDIKSDLVDIGEITPEIESYVKAVIDMEIETNNNVQVDLENWMSLNSLLKLTPSLLLNIPCSEIPKWQALINLQIPASVKNKITTLDNESMLTDYKIQYLEHASGAAINLDYFPVIINTLPNNPTTGIQFTPTEFLNYVRLKINNFVDTSISSFSPTTLSTGFNEAQIWNSSNPLGALIHIDIPFPAGDGSVVCSETNNNHWIFTTIEVPWKPTNSNADGIHPVSGNREFGLTQNPNGTYTFYTRGVDRMTDGIESIIGQNGNILLGSPFDNPDLLWNSLKTKIFNFVQNNNGSAQPLSSSPNVIWRSDWYKVRQVLRGEIPISDLGCN